MKSPFFCEKRGEEGVGSFFLLSLLLFGASLLEWVGGRERRRRGRAW
jgi:hypothetical protein